ncbi:nickel pincer cofactor biosynthesis protein LarB [bacterium]|nr:nickel pincer cofactor biosynthesis protein LarB [candidate division CSSED10-310 bacterium]
MNQETLRRLLEEVREGTRTIDEAVKNLRQLPFLEVNGSTVDLHRAVRQGFPEVIYGESKTAAQIAEIASAMSEDDNILITRVETEKATAVMDRLADSGWDHNPVARTLLLRRDEAIRGKGTIVVVSAGTSDLPVVEEACVTLRAMGNVCTRLSDVGVAGLHRLLSHLDTLQEARVAIVVAGMEGALPSVVGGLVACPVIAVPTSVGYGASFGGVTALLGMLNSCAANVTVVNIDNGFGAGMVASLINRC